MGLGCFNVSLGACAIAAGGTLGILIPPSVTLIIYGIITEQSIGRLFIEVFDQEARKIGGAEFLAQGTLYPDVIESVSITGGPSVTIKSHHNVGGLPERMKMKLVEPTPEDQALLKKVINGTRLPKWAARCSEQCVADFNASIGKDMSDRKSVV